MNRIVRENYPVAELPEILQEGLEKLEHVRITIEPVSDQQTATVAERRARLAQLYAEARPGFAGLDEIVAHIGALRRDRD